MNIQTAARIKELEDRLIRSEERIEKLESLIKYHLTYGNHTDSGPIMYGYDTYGMKPAP